MKVKGLNNLVADLIQKGIDPNQAGTLATQIFKTQAARNAGGVGSKAAMNPITREIIGELVGGGLLAGGASLVGGLGGAPGATTIAPRGKDYIMGPEAMRQARKDYYSPYNTILRNVFGVEMPTAEQQQERQIDKYGDLDDATRRQIAQRNAEIAGLASIAGLEGRLGVERERVAQEGAVGVQELRSLGDVQKQRVQSGYEAASGMLQKAIENIAYVEKLGQSDTRKQLAALPSI